MRDPYDVLGVAEIARSAAVEIKSAFRKLAKKYHPDQSKEPRAKERFAEVGSAYEILGDEKKRKAFDHREIDAEGKPRAPQFEGFGFGRQPGAGGRSNFGFDFDGGRFSAESGSIDPDILSELFGAGRTRARSQSTRGEDMGVSVMVPLATIAHGGSVRVALPTGKILDVAVPAGIEEGKSIRLRGQGNAGHRGAPPGDVIVTVRYAPSTVQRCEGRDLRLDLSGYPLRGGFRGAREGADAKRRGRSVDCAWRKRRAGPASARQGPARKRGPIRRRFAGYGQDSAAERGRCGTERVDAQATGSKALRPALGRRLNSLAPRFEQLVRDLQQ